VINKTRVTLILKNNLNSEEEIANAMKSRRRTGSTGGSSAKDAEIIGRETK
jgi:hypothetical protein